MSKRMSPDQLQELTAAVVRAVPRDLDSDVAQAWIVGDGPSALRGVLDRALREGPSAEPISKPPLTGTVVKTLRLELYEVQSIADAIRAGNYGNDTAEIVRPFAEDEVGLTDAVEVELVQFDRDTWYDEIIAWGAAQHKKPIVIAHLLGIGIQHPDEQREAPIVELGSVRHGRVLYLRGPFAWRDLDRRTVESDWHRGFLFGFVSE